MLSEIAAKIPPRQRPMTAREGATESRLAKAGENGFEVIEGRQRIVAAPLDRLYRDGRITGREHQAGERYRADHYLAAVDPGAGTVDWNRAGGGGASRFVPTVFTSQMIADARHRVRELTASIPDKSVVSSVLFLGLIKERTFTQIGQTCFAQRDERDASVAGKAGLRVALASLADVYGY